MVYWTVVAALVATGAMVVWGVWSLIGRQRHRTAHDPHKIQGIATRRDIDTVASKAALVRRGRTLRPSLAHPRAEDVGYMLGRSCGREIWASVDESILVIGPHARARGSTSSSTNAILARPAPS